METLEHEKKQDQQPGRQHEMTIEPKSMRAGYRGSDKLSDKIALITGGVSGIGKSAALHFAQEGAKVTVVYYNEEKDAQDTKEAITQMGGDCLLLKGDIKDEGFCKQAVEDTVNHFGKLNILVNNAAVQFPADSLEELETKTLRETFETNIFSFFYFTKAALRHLHRGDTVINTTSVTAYRGSEHLVDYASTKGAIVAFTRSLSKQLAQKGIRVNAIAPGPIWTPLIPATFDNLEDFGKDVPMGRPGEPFELGPAYVFLACEDSSYMTGQVIHINGGEIVGG
jgi:NAD(P)-dependent dehydrogenase (short-subunit alcohol dehydrogenase family)